MFAYSPTPFVSVLLYGNNAGHSAAPCDRSRRTSDGDGVDDFSWRAGGRRAAVISSAAASCSIHLRQAARGFGTDVCRGATSTTRHRRLLSAAPTGSTRAGRREGASPPSPRDRSRALVGRRRARLQVRTIAEPAGDLDGDGDGDIASARRATSTRAEHDRLRDGALGSDHLVLQGLRRQRDDTFGPPSTPSAATSTATARSTHRRRPAAPRLRRRLRADDLRRHRRDALHYTSQQRSDTSQYGNDVAGGDFDGDGRPTS